MNMTRRPFRAVAASVYGLLTILAISLPAQYREYLISGKVQDKANQPLADVEISLREQSTSRSLTLKTNKKGEFKFVGLSHGVFDVRIAKPGYVAKTDEWRFESPQEQMVKVDIPTVVLITQAQMDEITVGKQLQSELSKALDLLRQGHDDEAMAVLKRMLELKADDANALYLLARVQSSKGENREAAALLDRVVGINPAFADAYFARGTAYFRLEQLDAAIADFRKAMELEPERADILFNAGLVLYQKNEPAEALALFERTLTKRPDDPEAFEMAGRCLVQLDRFAQAVELFTKARALSRDAEKIRFYDEMIAKLSTSQKK